MQHKSIYQRRNLVLVVIFLLFGFWLRTTDIGANPLEGDEAINAYLAYDFGHNGVYSELGIVSSAGLSQPPFFHQVFAIPFAFDPDPRIARLFMAMLHLPSMAVLFWIVKRCWSSRTALVALLLYSTLPRAVWAGRYLWNPYLALPFLLCFLATGILIVEGKRWARWLHLPLLACVLQSHPLFAVIAVLTPLFYFRDWRHIRHDAKRYRRFIADHLVSVGLAFLVVLPWGIGYLHNLSSQPGAGQLTLHHPSTPAEIVDFIVKNPTTIDVGAFGIPLKAYIPPGGVLGSLADLLGWFAIVGSLLLLARSVMQRRYFYDAVIAIAFLALPVFSFISPSRTYGHYMVLSLPATAIIQAIFLTGGRINIRQPLKPSASIWSRRWSGLKTVIGLAGVLVCFVTQLAFILNVLQQDHNYPIEASNTIPPLNDMIHFVKAAVRPGVETFYLVDGAGPQQYTQALVWQTLGNIGLSRVIWGESFPLPVPPQGATYVGYASPAHIPELYGDRPTRLAEKDMYRVVDLPPHSEFTLTCRPQGPVRLSSGVTIQGYYVPTYSPPLPVPGHPWTIYLLWTAEPRNTAQSYQIFNHLVDQAGGQLAQNDVSALVTTLWRSDEQYVSRLTLTLTANGTKQPVALRVGMYTLLPKITNADALNDQGNPVGQWITIPVCETF